MDIKGFVSDIVAVFRLDNKQVRSGGSRSPATVSSIDFDVREFNFSAWSDEKAAGEWYRNSKGTFVSFV